MAKQDCVVAVFANYTEACDAALALEAAGYGSDISVIGRNEEGRLDAAGPLDHVLPDGADPLAHGFRRDSRETIRQLRARTRPSIRSSPARVTERRETPRSRPIAS